MRDANAQRTVGLFDDGAVRFPGARLMQGELEMAGERLQRRPQLMRRGRVETPLRRGGLGQPRQQAIQGRDQLDDLGIP
jgi:hypothetical protein